MTSKKINLDGSHRQLVDLNGNVVNFNLEFIITPSSEDLDKPYEIAITTQETLDLNDNIKFATVKGQFRKNIVNTSNEYQNYCVMLSSQKIPFTDMQIDINLKNLGVPEEKPKLHTSELKQPLVPAQIERPIQTKCILGAIVLVSGICLLYYFWTQNQKKNQPITARGPIVHPETSFRPPPVDVEPKFSFY